MITFVLICSLAQMHLEAAINPRAVGIGDLLLICDLDGDRYRFVDVSHDEKPEAVGAWQDFPGVNLITPPMATKISDHPSFVVHDPLTRMIWRVDPLEVERVRSFNNLGFHNFYLPNDQLVAVGSTKHLNQVAFGPDKRVMPLSRLMRDRGQDSLDFLVLPVPDQNQFLYFEPGDISHPALIGFDGEVIRRVRLQWPHGSYLLSSERAAADVLVTLASGFIAGGKIFLTTQDRGFLLETFVFGFNGNLVHRTPEYLVHTNSRGTVIAIVSTDGDYLLKPSTF